jgi:Alpha/beta hydrolase of unknown function (DUF900)
MTTPLFAIYQYLDQGQEIKIPGFFAVSTAPPNVEDQNNPDAANPLKAKDPKLLDNVELLPPSTAIQTVANSLLEKSKRGNKAVELVIAVHGYNSPIDYVKWWFREIWSYVNHDPLCSSERAVFLGYRWSSEKADILKNLPRAIQSLPVILAVLLFGGLGGAIVTWLKFNQITLLFAVCVFFASIVITLMILRLMVYFRDSYRAINFGVPDLVEIIRQLNKELNGKVEPNSIQINFIAHSMGAFVATNTIRILSDVFDPSSVGTIDATCKNPSSKIGDVFCLGRLVLAAPDIPARMIITGRANFLRSSLRRFEESYLFSNEGDLALRLASTAANYFSYPTNRRIEGHRLGNVTVKPGRKSDDPIYGVVNTGTIREHAPESHLINYLEINTLRHSITLNQMQLNQDQDEEDLCDSFTCFDCTGYVDRCYRNGKASPEQNVLSYRFDRFPSTFSFLNLFVYLSLIFAWLTGKIDVHGGYFQGEFSRDMIYKLAFSGFRDFLLSLDRADLPPNVRQQLDELNQKIAVAESQFLPNDEAMAKDLEVAIDHLHIRKSVILFEAFSAQCLQKKMQVAFSPKLYNQEIWPS